MQNENTQNEIHKSDLHKPTPDVSHTPCPDKIAKSDQNHPMWRLLNLLVLAIVVIVFSYTSASNFDETEADMIRNIIILMAAYEGIKTIIPRKKEGD